MHFSKSFRALSAVVPALVLAAGCGDSSATVGSQEELSGPFVAVPRALTSSDTSALSQALDNNALPSNSVNPNETFYLAIAKSELGKRWFLSAYMTQLFPRVYPGAFSLGTRVVSFKVQNGKLFVFDVDDRKKTSDSANPEVIVEAYPLVDSKAFQAFPNSSDYVLFDPAAGLNRFTMLTDAFQSPSVNARFQVDLMFSQRFRRISDGVTFDQVFTGASEAADDSNDGSLEPNPFKFSGSIGVALRRYSEGAGYTPTALPETEHYFRSQTKLLPNQSAGEQVAAHWNIKPGMKPIVWTISRDALKVAADPRFAAYDVIGSLKRGVENWNAVFGFKALEARVASPNDSAGDDDTNFIHVDFDNAFGFAFADWRTNPNTGEIRGASVYFSSMWFEIGDLIFEDDPVPNATARLAKVPQLTKPKVRKLSWDALGGRELCALHPADFLAAVSEGASAPAAAEVLTKKQKVERYITHVLIHEIGHTLGLRHNFKGSLKPTSSSVMEYIDDLEAIFHNKPGTYDTAAVKYLYGLDQNLPTDPFCTDEDTVVDPLCATFDRTDDPLTKDYGDTYNQVVTAFLNAQSNSTPNNTLNNVLKFVRAGGDAATRAKAFSLVSNGFAVPLDPAKAANAAYAARADVMGRVLLNRLYLDPAAARGTFSADPTDPAITALALAQAKGILLNSDSVRSFASRRVSVDVLKKMQSLTAYQALTDARTAITAARPSLAGNDALLTDDLLARINAAVSPYFVK